jgi:hypothetical protein
MLTGGYVASQRRSEEFMPSGQIKYYMSLTIVLDSGESTIVNIPLERYSDITYVEEQVQGTINTMSTIRDLHLQR